MDMLHLFRREKKTSDVPAFSLAEYEPVIRASICTGERVACMRSLNTGKLHEVMLIRSDADLEEFCKTYGLQKSDIRTVY